MSLLNEHASNPQSKQTILVGEPGNFLRESLKRLLKSIPDVARVDSAATSADFINLASTTSPTLVLLPFRFASETGITIAPQLKLLSPATKIVFCLDEISDTMLCEILACKPFGLISFQDSPQQIIKTIGQLLSGVTTDSIHLEKRAQKIRKHLSRSHGHKDIMGLTRRQNEVLRHLAFGHTAKEVAGKMHLSPK